MNKYSILCTPEQTKKAHALGAPIEVGKMTTYCANVGDVVGDKIIFEEIKNDSKIPVYSTLQIPTAEQMIGWLVENGFDFRINTRENAYAIVGYITLSSVQKMIDAALRYLEIK